MSFVYGVRDWKDRSLAGSVITMTSTNNRKPAYLLVAKDIPNRVVKELRDEARSDGYTPHIVRLDEARVAQFMAETARERDHCFDLVDKDESLDIYELDEAICDKLEERLERWLCCGFIYATVVHSEWARDHLSQLSGADTPVPDGGINIGEGKLERAFLRCVRAQNADSHIYLYDREVDEDPVDDGSPLDCIA